MNRRALIVASLFLAGLALIAAPLLIRMGAAQSRGAVTPAALATVTTSSVEAHSGDSRLSLIGVVKSGSEVSLSSQIGGPVRSVAVREGERVAPGSLLVLLDTAEVRRQIEAATAGAGAAQSAVRKAETALELKKSAAERTVAAAEEGVRLARAEERRVQAGIDQRRSARQAELAGALSALETARSALALARQGGKSEERDLLRIELEQARSAHEDAKKDLDELELLLKRGGVARSEVDAARRRRAAAGARVEAAEAKLKLFDRGTDPNEIKAAEARVRSAEAAHEAATKLNADQSLDKAELEAVRSGLQSAEAALQTARAGRREIELARQDLQTARAEYRRSLSALHRAEEQLVHATVRSPVHGVVTAIHLREGELASPGRPLVTITGRAGLYIEASLPAERAREVLPGSTALLVTPSGVRIGGTVRSLGARTASDSRSLPLMIDPAGRAEALTVGSAVDVSIRVRPRADALKVPASALRSEEGGAAIWLLRDGEVRAAEVNLVERIKNGVLIQGPVAAGERVIILAPAGVRPGDRVLEQRDSTRQPPPA